MIFIKLPAPSNHEPLWCQLKMMSMTCIRQTETQKTSCRLIMKTKWQFILIIRLVRHKPWTQTCTYTEPTKFASKKWPHLWQISHHLAVCSTEKDQSNKSMAEICCCAPLWLKPFCCTYDHTPISNVTAAVLPLTAGGSHLFKGQSELRHAWSFPKRTVNEIFCSLFKHCQIAMQANW